MGKQEEQIIIAQNGADNSAAASENEEQISYVKYEVYLLFIITCILAAMLYLLWKRCKVNYARFMRRELRELPLGDLRGGDQRFNGGSSPQCTRVIV